MISFRSTKQINGVKTSYKFIYNLFYDADINSGYIILTVLMVAKKQSQGKLK
jgi:hypothetical protein